MAKLDTEEWEGKDGYNPARLAELKIFWSRAGVLGTEGAHLS